MRSLTEMTIEEFYAVFKNTKTKYGGLDPAITIANFNEYTLDLMVKHYGDETTIGTLKLMGFKLK